MARSQHRVIRFLFNFTIVLIMLVEGGTMGTCMEDGGQEKANRLVTAYSNHIGAGMKKLDDLNDISFGDFGFHYQTKNNTVTVRVLIMRAHLTDWGPKAAANTRAVARALNDPAIGGMYENGGGQFVLDEKKQMFFLMKDVPVTIDTEPFIHAVDDFRNLGEIWVLHWVAHVADQALGHEPPPKHPVTRANDPYI